MTSHIQIIRVSKGGSHAPFTILATVKGRTRTVPLASPMLFDDLQDVFAGELPQFHNDPIESAKLLVRERLESQCIKSVNVPR